MRDDAIEVPDHVWASEPMHDALRGRRMGEVLRLAAKYAGASQTRLANVAGLSQAEISRIISGERQISAIDLFERIASGLGMPDEARILLGLAPLSGAKMLTVTTGPEAWELVDAMTRSSIGSETVKHMERAALGLAMSYPYSMPDRLLPQVQQQMSRMREALGQPQSLRVRRQCIQVVGVLSGIAGNLHLDLGDVNRAEAYFEAGQTAGWEAEDDALAAWLLATQSIGPYFADQPALTVELLRTAGQRAANGASARRQAWVAALRARAHAAAGQRSDALEALDIAARHLAQAEAPTGLDFFDGPRLEGIAGSCHRLLGNIDEAAGLLAQAIDRRAPSDAKGRALLTLDLADCRIAEGEVEEACRLAGKALDIADGSVVRPILDRAQSLQVGMEPWKKLSPVVALTGRFRDMTAPTAIRKA